MDFSFKDNFNRPVLMFAAITTFIAMLAFGLISKIYKFGVIGLIPAVALIVLMYYFLYEMQRCMDMNLSDNGIEYIGKRSKWFISRIITKKYRWDEVSSITFTNGFRIISVNFTNNESIKFQTEAEKTHRVINLMKLHWYLSIFCILIWMIMMTASKIMDKKIEHLLMSIYRSRSIK